MMEQRCVKSNKSIKSFNKKVGDLDLKWDKLNNKFIQKKIKLKELLNESKKML